MMFDLKHGAPGAVYLVSTFLFVVSTGCSAFRPLVEEQPKAMAPVDSSTLDETQRAARPEPAGRVVLGKVNGRSLYSTDLDTSLQEQIARSRSEALQREMHLLKHQLQH